MPATSRHIPSDALDLFSVAGLIWISATIKYNPDLLPKPGRRLARTPHLADQFAAGFEMGAEDMRNGWISSDRLDMDCPLSLPSSEV